MASISVIIPVYKVEKYIHRCVDSILAQTFTDFEMILVDDGSPDNCGIICDEYAEKDNRIHVIHKKNGGLSDARNAGIDWAFANSDSEWITFIDSDDWVHPSYLMTLYQLCLTKHTNISVVKHKKVKEYCECDFSFSNSQGLKLETEKFFSKYYSYAVIAWGKLYRKELFFEVRFPFGKLHEDEFTTYKLLFNNFYISFYPEPLYYYFNNPDGIMHESWSTKRLVAFDALDEQLRFFKKNKFSKAYITVANSYLDNIYWQLNAVEKLSTDIQKKYQRDLIRVLRRKLLKFYPVLGFNFSYLQIAFPRFSRLYWKLARFKENR